MRCAFGEFGVYLGLYNLPKYFMENEEDFIVTGHINTWKLYRMLIENIEISLNGYNVEVDPSAGHTDPSIKAFFSPTDDLTILLLFS